MDSTACKETLSAPKTEDSDALGTIFQNIDELHGLDLDILAHTKIPQAFREGLPVQAPGRTSLN